MKIYLQYICTYIQAMYIHMVYLLSQPPTTIFFACTVLVLFRASRGSRRGKRDVSSIHIRMGEEIIFGALEKLDKQDCGVICCRQLLIQRPELIGSNNLLWERRTTTDVPDTYFSSQVPSSHFGLINESRILKIPPFDFVSLYVSPQNDFVMS